MVIIATRIICTASRERETSRERQGSTTVRTLLRGRRTRRVGHLRLVATVEGSSVIYRMLPNYYRLLSGRCIGIRMGTYSTRQRQLPGRRFRAEMSVLVSILLLDSPITNGEDRNGQTRRRKATQRTCWVGKKGRTPTGGGAQTPPIPRSQRSRGGLKHHTVISCTRHLPWMGANHNHNHNQGCQAEGARASEAGAGREKVHPTKHRGTAERERSTAPELH